MRRPSYQLFAVNFINYKTWRKNHYPVLVFFIKEEEGKLRFKSAELPDAFLPPVSAERVIHPDVAHNMIVGSRETNTTAMTNELLGEEQQVKSKWWIAALVLAGIGLAVIAIWLTTDGKINFGNASEVTPATAPKTYKTGDR